MYKSYIHTIIVFMGKAIEQVNKKKYTYTTKINILKLSSNKKLIVLFT
jgi:hypothetical protein